MPQAQAVFSCLALPRSSALQDKCVCMCMYVCTWAWLHVRECRGVSGHLLDLEINFKIFAFLSWARNLSRCQEYSSQLPREMQTVYVWLQFPPWASTPSTANYFIRSCHIWQAFLEWADSFIRATGRFRQTQWNMPFWSSVLYSPTLRALIYINSYPNQTGGQMPHIQIALCSWQGISFLQRELLLGFHRYYRIIESRGGRDLEMINVTFSFYRWA